MNYEALGHRIRLQRKSCKLTQGELAGAIGLSTSFLGHVERGTRKASLETIIAVASSLNITPNELLQDSFDIPDRVPPQVKNCTDEMRLLLERIEYLVSS